jgi:hypothetical protein
MDEKRFRFDLFIACCALLLSAIAAGASAYQTYVINQQYQASIWPYLGFSFSSGDKALSLTVKNYGLGPALIRYYVVTRNGKPINSLSDYVARHEHHGESADVSVDTIGDGTIIPASESVPLVSVQGAGLVKGILADQASLDVSICYCSLLGRCWMKTVQDPLNQPRDVRVCPLQTTPRIRGFGSPAP